MVDWPLALQIAGFAAGSDPKVDLGVDLVGRTRALETEVITYTGLEPATPVPEGSTTRPTIVPNVDCAIATTARRMKSPLTCLNTRVARLC